VKDLRRALDGTLICLKRLTAGPKKGMGFIQAMALSSHKSSLVSIQAALQQNATSSKAADAVSNLRGLQSDINTCREKMDSAFLRIMRPLNVVSDQRSRVNTHISTLTMPVVRNKLVNLFKSRTDRRYKSVDIVESIDGQLASTTPSGTDEVPVRSPSSDTFAGSPLLQLPTELLILIITALNEDFLDLSRTHTDTLPALRL
jgi:hypothetical protein